jgi:hypothetical protein
MLAEGPTAYRQLCRHGVPPDLWAIGSEELVVNAGSGAGVG